MNPARNQPHITAVIDEPACIGCTLCIEACPVDAIVGAAGLMHTVIDAECTSCRWCVPACPVDCITMVETGKVLTHEDRRQRTAQYKRRYLARRARLDHATGGQPQDNEQAKRAIIERAMERARQRLQERGRS
jgi:Na+-translocating ferredoxin:NAD+ oxidoreductase subunit B